MLSLCLTNYNRYEMLLESFQHVYDDERIAEIVIVDDASDWKIYSKLEDYCRDKKKIKLFRNERNLGMSLNKKKAVELSAGPWCILFDSDNVLKPDYLDALEGTGGVQNGLGLDTTTIYAPDWNSTPYYGNVRSNRELMTGFLFALIISSKKSQ